MRGTPTCRHVQRHIVTAYGARDAGEHLSVMTVSICPVSRWRTTSLAALTCLLAFAPGLLAQSDRFFVPLGTRVRIVVGANAPFTGNVLRLTSDTLAVATGSGGALIQIATSRLSSIELSEGRDRLHGSLKGAGIGVLAGGLIGGVSLGRSEGNDLAALAGMFAGGIIGAGTGAIVGAIVAPERWHRLSLSGASR